MMDSSKDKTFSFSQESEDKDQSFGEEKNIYDIINSEELELLYKKNAHLLARLSKTGKENTHLHTRLSSLSKEKSQLGNRNTVLKNKYLGLKEQISLFARQHREFNHQSRKLKEELREVKKIQVQEPVEKAVDSGLFKKQEREIRLLEKKEQVYKKQIHNLQSLYKKRNDKNKMEHKALQREQDRNIRSLEEKIQHLHQILAVERDKAKLSGPSQIRKIKEVNKLLNKQCKELKKELKAKAGECQWISREKEKTQNVFQKKLESLKKHHESLQAENKEKVKDLEEHLKGKLQELVLLEKRLQELKKEKRSFEKKKEVWISYREKYEALQEDREQQIEEFKKQLRESSEDLALLEKRLQELKKEKRSFEKKEKKLNHLAQELKEKEQFVLEESQKVKNRKVKAGEFQKIQEELLHCKDQNSALVREKEQLQSGFASQIHLFAKERDSLKFQCESLKQAVSLGKQGFDQAMLSFRRKYARLYKSQEALQKKIKEKKALIQTLEEQTTQLQKQFFQKEGESESQIKKEKDRYISELCGELKAAKENNRDLENQIQLYKKESKNLFLKEKRQMQEEIKNLKWSREKSLLSHEESHKAEVEELKSDYENRIEKLSLGFEKKLQHIRIEMENDLHSERKRYDLFKDMKTRQIQDLQNSLSFLQSESQELKTKRFVLEKSLAETKESLNRHLKSGKRWEEQSRSLKTLWQELQKQNEAKDQQIQSLQKLNRSLSLSLNQTKKTETSDSLRISPSNKSSLFSKSVSADKREQSEDEKKSFNRVLADIHFD